MCSMMNPSETAISVENVVKVYRERSSAPVRTLDRLSLQVRPGEVFGLLGRNGAGITVEGIVLSYNLAYFVLMFASSIFYPLEGMPSWMRTMAMANPLTWHTNVLRFATVGSNMPVLLESGAFILFLAASFLLALRALRDAVVK